MKNLLLTEQLVSGLLDGDMPKKAVTVMEAAPRKKAKKAVIEAPVAEKPKFDEATIRVLQNAGLLLDDGTWAQGSNAGKDEVPTKANEGPLLAPGVVKKFLAVDTSKDKKLLAWMLFQAAGGHAGMRETEAHLEEAKEMSLQEWTVGYYIPVDSDIRVASKKIESPEAREAEWARTEPGLRKALMPADEELMNRYSNAVFGYRREWPGYDGIYEKVATASAKYVENITKSNGISKMDRANLAGRQKAFRRIASQYVTDAVFGDRASHGILSDAQNEAVRKLVSYLASNERVVPPQPLGENPTEPARARYAIMAEAYEIASKAVASGKMDQGLRERVESEIGNDPDGRPLDASLSLREFDGKGGKIKPLSSLDAMQQFNHSVFVRFARSQAEKNTKYVVPHAEPSPTGEPPRGAYHQGGERAYYENSVYKVVIPATLAASVQSVEHLFRPEKPGERQFCTSVSSQYNDIFRSDNRDPEYHWKREQNTGPIVYLIAKQPMPPALASSWVRLVSMQFTSPDMHALGYYMKNNSIMRFAAVRAAAEQAGVGAEFEDAAQHAVEAMRHVRDMIFKDVLKESAERLVTSLLD